MGMTNALDRYKCEKCGEVFRLKATYDSHIEKHKEKKLKSYGDFEIKTHLFKLKPKPMEKEKET